jgi:hypothetical protein
LNTLKSVAGENPKRVVNLLCLGRSLFVRFWSQSPESKSELDYNKWHSYWLKDKAPGYFINNVVGAMANDSVRVNQDVWFPTTGKETKKLDEIALLD